MISNQPIRFSSRDEVIDHMRPDSDVHAKDKEFFCEGWGSCEEQPFLDCRHLLPELAAYKMIGDGLLAPSSLSTFRRSSAARDERGRKRNGTVGYKVVCSASDRVQGYLSAVEDRGLRTDLCHAVHWHCLRAITKLWESNFISAPTGKKAPARSLRTQGVYLLGGPHWDTARFHSEFFFAVYGPDGKRRIRGVRSDGALISALASRHAAGFEEPDFRIKPENLRWNSRLAMTLERELLDLCREFYRANGLDFSAAEKKTAWLQTEGRSERGKKLAAGRNSPALRYESPCEAPKQSTPPLPLVTPIAGAVVTPVLQVVHAELPLSESKAVPDVAAPAEDVADSKSSRPPAPTTKKTLTMSELRLLMNDLIRISRDEPKEKLHRPSDWITNDGRLDLVPKILALLEDDDSEDSKEILRMRKLMLRLQDKQKEEQRSAERDNEMFP